MNNQDNHNCSIYIEYSIISNNTKNIAEQTKRNCVQHQNRSMKKSQLYHLIYSLIQRSKQQKINLSAQSTHNFVNSYCQKFLKRNKLVSKNKRQKIKDLMKSFQYLDSYVDLSQVVLAIENHIDRQIHNNNVQESKKQASKMKVKTEPIQEQSKISTIKKAENIIKYGYEEGRYLQLNNCKQIVNHLEQNSNQLNNAKYKNNSSALTFHQVLGKRYTEGRNWQKDAIKPKSFKKIITQQKNQQSFNLNCQLVQNDEKKQLGNPWRLLQEKQNRLKHFNNDQTDYQGSQNGYDLFSLTQLKNNSSISDPKLKGKNIFDESKMLHTAAVYLHLILQRQHHKKWALQKQRFNLTQSLSKLKKSANVSEPVCKNSMNLLIRSTCTEQNSQCNGLPKQTRDFSEQFVESQNIRKQDKIKTFTANIHKQVACQNKQDGQHQSKPLTGQLRKRARIQFKQNISANRQTGRMTAPKALYMAIRTEPTLDTKKYNPFLEKRLSINRNNEENNLKIKFIKPRHTLANPQNIQSMIKKSPQKQHLQQKQQQNKIIRDKFTFKKRKVKQRVLRKITQFVNDIEHVQRNMIIQTKRCEKQLNQIQNKMNFEFQFYQSQKILHDEKALQGVRCALNKISTGQKRYH